MGTAPSWTCSTRKSSISQPSIKGQPTCNGSRGNDWRWSWTPQAPMPSNRSSTYGTRRTERHCSRRWGNGSKENQTLTRPYGWTITTGGDQSSIHQSSVNQPSVRQPDPPHQTPLPPLGRPSTCQDQHDAAGTRYDGPQDPKN